MSREPGGIHVLIVTFGYEPLAHVSAKRPSRMARELVRQGLDVSVLTVDWRPEPRATPRDLERAVVDALASPAPRVVAVDGRLCNPEFDPLGTPRSTEPAGPRLAVARRTKTLVDTIGWGAFPRWARLAFTAARKLHRAKPIDVIWAIHGDNSSHEIAYRLHRAEGIPWVADFKDPWDHFHSALAKPIQRWATARRVRSAATLTETCAAQAAADAAEFACPVEVVYSGYEAATMAAAPPERPGDGISAAYFGNIGAQHDPSLLVEVFDELSRRGVLERAGVRIHQFTRLPGQIGGVLAGRVGSPGTELEFAL